MDNIYGFDTTDEVKFDANGLPVGTYKAMAVSEEPFIKENVRKGVIVEWECLEGAEKGRKGKVWYNTLHKNETTKKIAHQTLKRIAEASGAAITMSSPIKGRVLTLEVGPQKKNPDYTEVKKYHPENHTSQDAPF